MSTSNADSVAPSSPQKKKFKMPDIYVVLGVFILFAAFLTYVVPAGEYERTLIESPTGGMRSMVVPQTYQQIESKPVGFLKLASAIPGGLERAANVVFLTFLVGGCMGLIKRAGIVDMGVNNLINAVGDKGFLVIPILMVTFSTLASFIGTPELSLAYLPVLLPLFYRLGYDGMTAVAVAMLGPCLGFTFGVAIPASVGAGQAIAEIKMFSGSGFRFVIFVIMVIVGVAYVMWYANRIKKDPLKSLSKDSDVELRAKIQKEEANRGELVFNARQKIAGIACLVMFPSAVALILIKSLGFKEISGLFLFIGITAAAIAGKKVQEICDDLNAGMRDMMVPSLICGIASSIAVVMDFGLITDTLVYWLENMMNSVPSSLVAIAIFWEQSLFNCLIPSASGLTFLTMPIISALAQLLDIPAQVVVSANAWGGQITDIFFPTSGFFLATMAIGKIEYGKWIRFYTPLMLTMGVIASIALYCMQAFSIGLT